MLWVATVMLAGYFLGAAFPTLGENIDKAMLVILAFSVIPVVLEWRRHRHSGRRRQDDSEATPEVGADATVDAAPPALRRR